MIWAPNALWAMWKAKTGIKKFLLFIPIIVAMIIGGILFFVLRKEYVEVPTSNSPAQTSKDASEEFYEKHLSSVKKRDTILAAKIKFEVDKRSKLKKKQIQRNKESESKHAAIDNADSISDVDRVLWPDARSRNRRK
jgi:phosphate/sulfate permease